MALARANGSVLTQRVTPDARIAASVQNGSSLVPRWVSPGDDSLARKRGAAEVQTATRVQTCELRDDSKAGAVWDVMILQDGEPLFSRRCVDERATAFESIG